MGGEKKVNLNHEVIDLLNKEGCNIVGFADLRCLPDEARLNYNLWRWAACLICLAVEGKRGGICELHNLAVLPEYHHKSYGKRLLDFCKEKVKKQGGSKIIIDIIEENTVLKNWYAANGFIHTGTKTSEGTLPIFK